MREFTFAEDYRRLVPPEGTAGYRGIVLSETLAFTRLPGLKCLKRHASIRIRLEFKRLCLIFFETLVNSAKHPPTSSSYDGIASTRVVSHLRIAFAINTNSQASSLRVSSASLRACTSLRCRCIRSYDFRQGIGDDLAVTDYSRSSQVVSMIRMDEALAKASRR